jgi:hypothetical protein
VRLPGDVRTSVEATAHRGRLRTEFALRPARDGAAERLQGRLGTGGGALSIDTKRGDVALLRGPDRGAAPERVDSFNNGRTYLRTYDRPLDPNPNPDPSPRRDADPDPAPDPARDDDPVDVSGRNPTGERFDYVAPSAVRLRDAAQGQDSVPILRMLAAAAHEPTSEVDLVRDRARWALSLVVDGHLVEPLINVLENDSDWRRRAYAAWALGVAGAGRAGYPVALATKDAHWRVRMHAVYAVAELSGRTAVPWLVEALRDDVWQVRIGAAEQLAAVGDARSAASLREAMRIERHPAVRDAMESAARRLERGGT